MKTSTSELFTVSKDPKEPLYVGIQSEESYH